ncbi:MAG: hypothetical protein ACKVPY_00365 [Paracoccaceae bacterium]
MLVAAVLTGLLHSGADAGGTPARPFIDGRWQGGIETGPDSPDFAECWAGTTFGDGTTLTLAERRDGTWLLRLSNPGWQLPDAQRYTMLAQVDFYPRLRVSAEARTPTLLEIADPDPTSLVGLIEYGHTINLASVGFNEKYDLEGSAKIIERIRTCSAGRFAAERPATKNGPGQ